MSGNIIADNTVIRPGQILNTNLQYDTTTFSISETGSGTYHIDIKRLPNNFPGTSYVLSFDYVGQNAAEFTNATYQRASSRFFGQPVVSRTTLASSQISSTPIVCFVTGTKIRTKRGEVAVEDLRVGDFAVTASGALRPITWIGHREITAEAGSLPFHQQPVHVRAGAFGHGLPARDLFLSPGHPVLVGADADNEGGVLVPVMCLINGTSITREPRATVTYWHVELDAHDILLAEGLPAESYIDGGDRVFFAEASDHALHNPDFVPAGWNGRCRPVAVEGSVVEAERLRLDAVFAGSLNAQCRWDANLLVS
ncbi:Hint domain-containing protein [Methylorubrum populi]